MPTNRLPASEDPDTIYGCVAKVQGHHYVVMCTRATISEALRTLGCWACDSRLNFTWHDAARCANKLEKEGALS